MRRETMPSAPNYTNAALLMGVLNLFCIFTAIWAAFGLLPVLVVGYLLDKLISRMARRQYESNHGLSDIRL